MRWRLRVLDDKAQLVVTAAIKAGTPELPCKTQEEFKRLMEATAESVGCSTYALPMVLG